MNLQLLKQREEVFINFLIKCKEESYSRALKVEKVITNCDSITEDENRGWKSNYCWKWNHNNMIGFQYVNINEDYVWQMNISGEIKLIPSDLSFPYIHKRLLEAILSKEGKYVIPVRGPITIKLDKLRYSSKTISKDGVFDFTIEEKLTTLDKNDIVYEGICSGKLKQKF